MLQQKGKGRAIHISDFLDEKSETGRLSLSPSQLTEHDKLPLEHKVVVTDACKIIYPGKGKDDYNGIWLNFFHKLLGVGNKGIWVYSPGRLWRLVFDCSSAHDALSDDALNVNNMNAKPGGKQNKLHDTDIPDNIPFPQHLEIRDTRGQFQPMVFPNDHPDPSFVASRKAWCKSVGSAIPIGIDSQTAPASSPLGHAKCASFRQQREMLLRGYLGQKMLVKNNMYPKDWTTWWSSHWLLKTIGGSAQSEFSRF